MNFNIYSYRDQPIETEFVYPSIPARSHDWSAIRHGYEPGDLIGYGPTEQDAIDDLIEQEESNV